MIIKLAHDGLHFLFKVKRGCWILVQSLAPWFVPHHHRVHPPFTHSYTQTGVTLLHKTRYKYMPASKPYMKKTKKNQTCRVTKIKGQCENLTGGADLSPFLMFSQRFEDLCYILSNYNSKTTLPEDASKKCWNRPNSVG